MADFVTDLYRLQKFTDGLRSLLDASVSGASSRIEASDRSYAVLVVLAPDGTVESIRVDEDWKRKVRPEALGAAIMQAYSAAAAQRVRAWTAALTESDWQEKADRLKERIDADPGEPEPQVHYPRDLSRVAPRDPAAITAEVGAVLDSLGDLDGPPVEVTGTGTAGFGKLAVTLSPSGLISCAVDPMWAGQQTGTDLTEALGLALAAARDALAAAVAQGPAGRLNTLLDQALVNLHRFEG
jgi:hypothetical protein